MCGSNLSSFADQVWSVVSSPLNIILAVSGAVGIAVGLDFYRTLKKAKAIFKELSLLEKSLMSIWLAVLGTGSAFFSVDTYRLCVWLC